MQHSFKKFCSFLFILLSFMVNSLSYTFAQEPISSQVALEKVLEKHKGKVVYLDFWASWCGPCRKSFPWMNQATEKYKALGFAVISVNLDANHKLAEQFLKENPAKFSVIYDPKGSIARHFKIQGMPSSMLIGRDGSIKQKHTGFFTNKIPEYQSEIEQLLSQEGQ